MLFSGPSNKEMPPKKAAAGGAGGPEPKKEHMIIKAREATVYISPTSKTRKARRYHASEKPEKPIAAAIEFFKKRVILNGAIMGSPDGPHTWILKQLPDESLLLAAAATVSRQELGTLHKNLDAFTPPAPVIAAGELAKAGKTVVFNLLSGSYMEKHFKGIKDAAERARRQEEILTIVSDHMKSLGFEEVAFLEGGPGGAPILNAAEIITAANEMAAYNRLLSASNVESPPPAASP